MEMTYAESILPFRASLRQLPTFRDVDTMMSPPRDNGCSLTMMVTGKLCVES